MFTNVAIHVKHILKSELMTCPMFCGHTCSILLIMYFLSLNWIIADLQCCVNFCCIEKWFIYTCTYMLFHILFHYDLSQAIKYSFLGTTVAPHPSPVLGIVRLCLLSPDSPSWPLVSLATTSALCVCESVSCFTYKYTVSLTIYFPFYRREDWVLGRHTAYLRAQFVKMKD